MYNHELILMMVERGNHPRKIAEIVGCSRALISYVLKKFKKKAIYKSQFSKTKHNHKRIVRLSEDGFNRKEISEIVGCSLTTVSRAFRKLNHTHTPHKGVLKQYKRKYELIRKMAAEGIPKKDIATTFNLSRERIRSILVSQANNPHLRARNT